MKITTKITLTALIGIILGERIGFLFSLGFSIYYGTNNFAPSSPEFVAKFSSNTEATAMSALIWALIGILFSVSSLIFNSEKMSITKQAISHFLITFFGFTPLAIAAGWFPLTLESIIEFLIIFIIIYGVMWFTFMAKAKADVKEINRRIKENSSANL